MGLHFVGSVCDGSNGQGRFFRSVSWWPLKWLCQMAICTCCSTSVGTKIDHRLLLCVYSMLVMCMIVSLGLPGLDGNPGFASESGGIGLPGDKGEKGIRVIGPPGPDGRPGSDGTAGRPGSRGDVTFFFNWCWWQRRCWQRYWNSSNYRSEEETQEVENNFWLLGCPRINLENVSVFESQWICWILNLQYIVDGGISTA